MSKQGMRRYRPGDIHGGRNPDEQHEKNDIDPVPEIKGKAKSGKKKAGPM